MFFLPETILGTLERIDSGVLHSNRLLGLRSAVSKGKTEMEEQVRLLRKTASMEDDHMEKHQAMGAQKHRMLRKMEESGRKNELALAWIEMIERDLKQMKQSIGAKE